MGVGGWGCAGWGCGGAGFRVRARVARRIETRYEHALDSYLGAVVQRSGCRV